MKNIKVSMGMADLTNLLVEKLQNIQQLTGYFKEDPHGASLIQLLEVEIQRLEQVYIDLVESDDSTINI